MAVITISRSVASLGDTLAVSLAEHLNYRLVDRAELVRLAAGSGATDALERSPELRERSPSFWERLNEERRRYASLLRNAVTQLAAEDNLVIVGLGGGQLLRSLKHVLRLQIIAPLDVRIERLMAGVEPEYGNVPTRDQARDIVRQRDRDVAGYMRYLFNIDWVDPQNWDLVINTGRLSEAQILTIVSGIVGSGLLEADAADRQRLEDLTLASQVEASLLNQASVWINGLRVRAEQGRVRLEGEVIVEDDREAAEQVALGVAGVKQVDNDLRIQPPPLTGM
jgi:cytidylate kinase